MKFRFISLMCIYYIVMVSYCWLQVMCFHMWRTVTTAKAISGRSFHVYTLYALGLPVICCTAFSIDLRITGWEIFLHRYFLGESSYLWICIVRNSNCMRKKNCIWVRRVGFPTLKKNTLPTKPHFMEFADWEIYQWEGISTIQSLVSVSPWKYSRLY